MKQKNGTVPGKSGQCHDDKTKTGTTDESTFREKLELQNSALEKIKSAVLINSEVTQGEDE